MPTSHTTALRADSTPGNATSSASSFAIGLCFENHVFLIVVMNVNSVRFVVSNSFGCDFRAKHRCMCWCVNLFYK